MNREEQITTKIIATMVVIGILSVLLFSCFYTIRSGDVGVIRTFGEYDDNEISAGLHTKMPFVQNVEKVTIRTNQVTETFSLPSKEGLIVSMDATVIFKYKESLVSEMLQNVQGSAVDTLLIPNFRSAVRDVASGYEAKEMYSDSGREEITQALKIRMQEKLPTYFILEDILLRDVVLPDKVKNAIEMKIDAEQKAQAKEFELLSAKKDAEIEVARAKGIAEANDIIAGSITENYIRYKFVEGLNDGNTEVIYVPTEANLPILEARG